MTHIGARYDAHSRTPVPSQTQGKIERYHRAPRSTCEFFHWSAAVTVTWGPLALQSFLEVLHRQVGLPLIPLEH